MSSGETSLVDSGCEASGSSQDSQVPEQVPESGDDASEKDSAQLTGDEGQDLSEFVMTDEFELQLSGEALDALEESLKQQLEGLIQEKKQFDDMFEQVSSRLQQGNDAVLAAIENVRAATEEVHIETKEVILERDSDLDDIRNTEQAFIDVNRKYERSIIVMENTKASEDVLRQKAEDLEACVRDGERKDAASKRQYQEHVQSTFEGYLERVAQLDLEGAKLSAVNRRAEMRAETLATELKRKMQENAELNSLTDELIGKSAGSM